MYLGLIWASCSGSGRGLYVRITPIQCVACVVHAMQLTRDNNDRHLPYRSTRHISSMHATSDHSIRLLTAPQPVMRQHTPVTPHSTPQQYHSESPLHRMHAAQCGAHADENRRFSEG